MDRYLYAAQELGTTAVDCLLIKHIFKNCVDPSVPERERGRH